MPVSVISSLSLFARERAMHTLLNARGEGQRPAQVLTIDVLDQTRAGEFPFKLTRTTATTTSVSTLPVEAECVSCATGALVDEALESFDDDAELIIALPTAISVAGTLQFAKNRACTVRNVVIALDITTFEDELWTRRVLADFGVTPDPSDERTPGEFLVGELGWADTAVTAEIPLTHATESEVARATELLEHLAPHLKIVTEPTAPCGCFEFEDARTRTVSGHLPPQLNHAHGGQERTLKTPTVHRGSNFATVLVRADGVIDQELFSQALPKMVEGACRVRGVVSLSDYSGERIAIEGIGPAVWLENTGLLDATEATPGTSIAITGDDVDAAEIQQLLESCVSHNPAHA